MTQRRVFGLPQSIEGSKGHHRCWSNCPLGFSFWVTEGIIASEGSWRFTTETMERMPKAAIGRRCWGLREIEIFDEETTKPLEESIQQQGRACSPFSNASERGDQTYHFYHCVLK